MKPWPEKLREAYPSLPGRVPERPWWWTPGECTHGKAVSCWGGSGPVPYFYRDTVRADGLYVCCESKDMTALREAADTDQPLPHPGFRVGQIWGDEEGETRLVVGMQWGTIPLICGEHYSDADNVWVAQLACLNKDRFCYLIADPCCPWLAPWSPP